MAVSTGPTVTLTFRGDSDHLRREIAGIGTMIAGVAGTVGILGGIGAAASATVVAVAALPAAFLGIGIAAAAQSEAVKARFTEMKDHVVASVTALARPIEAELLRSADSIQRAYDRIAPSLGRIFEMAAPHLRMFTDGLIALVENAMPGFETAIRNADPLVASFSRGLGTLGTGVGGFFAELTKGTPGAVAGMDALFGLTKDLLIYLGQLAAQLANALGPAFAAMTGPVMDLVRALGDGLLAIAQALAPHLGELARTIADLVTAAIRALTPVVQAVLPLLAEMANTVGQLLIPVIEMLAPVLAAVSQELADALRPILPEIIAGFRDMMPVMRDIAAQAGPLLVEMIRTLAPLLLELVRGALELTQALLPVIPPLLEMANNAMPLLAGVIKDVLIPIIKFLVTEFKGLIDFGVKIAENFADLSVRWRTYWDEIKAAFADANTKIRAGIEAFASLPETARKHWDAMYQAIKTKIEEIVAWAVDFPQRIIDAILGYIDRFKQAGATLIQSFADGINSKASAATDAAGNVVGGTAALFPQSPAKEGPFSGSGYTFDRGQKLIEDFGRGITDAAPRLADLARQAMEGAKIAISGFTGSGSGGTVNASSPGLGSLQLQVAPGVDSALSSLLMNLVRAGQLQLQRAG